MKLVIIEGFFHKEKVFFIALEREGRITRCMFNQYEDGSPVWCDTPSLAKLFGTRDQAESAMDKIKRSKK
jgi:hypothetical protein